jgi:hypothetical protein
VLAPRTDRRKLHRAARAALAGASAAGFACVLASCGGSSSETPPPLEPSPANVHYDRAATTLPGELGTPTRPAKPEATTPAPAPTPFHPHQGGAAPAASPFNHRGAPAR